MVIFNDDLCYNVIFLLQISILFVTSKNGSTVQVVLLIKTDFSGPGLKMD